MACVTKTILSIQPHYVLKRRKKDHIEVQKWMAYVSDIVYILAIILSLFIKSVIHWLLVTS